MTVERIHAEEQRDFIDMLDHAFSSPDHIQDFRAIIPMMCRETEDRAQRHFGIKEDGKFVAGLGVYPLPTIVAGEQIVFSTMGNVGTIPEVRGKGYMSSLLEVAMKELDDLQVDASRLGGKPARYGRYGYQTAGTLFHYDLDAYGTGEGMPSSFRLITPDDIERLDACKVLQEKSLVYVKRKTPQDFYDTLVAWGNVPYTYEDENGNVLGYVSMGKSLNNVSEIEAKDFDTFKEMLRLLCAARKGALDVELMPHRLEEKAYLDKEAHHYSSCSSSMYKVLHIEPLMRAFLKLKAKIYQMADMEEVIEIEKEGIFRVGFKNGEAVCERVNEKPAISYTYDEAIPAIFATYTQNMPVYKTIFPLPLSWNGQDRV